MQKRKIKINVDTAFSHEKSDAMKAENAGIVNQEIQAGSHVNIVPEKKKRFSRLKLIFKLTAYGAVFTVVGLAFFSFFAEKNIISEKKETSWFRQLPVISQFQNLVEGADKKMKGEENDRINILLLGMGGKNHSGAYLTDTIMLVSIQPSTKKVALLSIPRDMAVPIEGVYGWRKINNINALAENKQPGSGGTASMQAIGDILNVQIDYYVRADFEGFTKIVDQLGGVTVDVENNLDDYSYPVLGRESSYPYSSRYEHLHIEKGIQQMDGETALKYARSRHGVGAEGSDFARAKRQQKIMEGIKEKALSVNMLFKPMTIKNILDTLSEHVSLNLELWEMVRMWDLVKDVKKDQIINKVLDNSPGGLLRSTIGDSGAYLLEPKSGDYTEIQYLANHILDEAPKELKTEVVSEEVNIEVQNGTWINGLASKISVDLEKLGFHVINIKNCVRQNFQKSVIYDLTYGKKMSSLQILKDKTGANVAFGVPEWLVSDINKNYGKDNNNDKGQPDFILIIGQDAMGKPSLDN
jgi:polyisoprenyl-teichoic acid--peptidoglycan teichoic acid transferase